MHSTMQERLTGMIRGGLAVTLASTLMVPAAALANPAQGDAANQAARTQQAQGSSASVAAESAAQAADSDQSADSDTNASNQDVSALLTSMGGATSEAEVGETAGGTNLLDGVGQDPNEKVTIIVQLEDGGNQGVSLFSNLLGRAQQDRHAYFKDCIRQVVAQQLGTDENGGIQLFSTQAADDAVQELHDYYHVIDGFAIKAPAGVLDDIKAMDGVKRAFLGENLDIPKDEGEQAAPKNQSSLDMTAADQVEETGEGQTVAIIDSGVATGHEAFSGDLDDNAVALTSGAVSGLQGSMVAGGQHGVYVSEKIPFAYDYADYDTEVTPKSSDLEHGTHVAGIAAANAGEIRGTAPDSQIIAMKVASDVTGSIPNDAILAALDDCAVLAPDAINMSLGTDGGFSKYGSEVFDEALHKLEDLGVTVNVAAGNAYSAAFGNQSGESKPYAEDPDSGIVSSPSTSVSAFSVASVNNSLPRSAFKAADGTVIGYDKMGIQRNGQNSGETAPDLTSIEDGTYDLVDLGYGSADETNEWGNANNWDLSNKIVLVKRGKANESDPNLTFTEKIQNIMSNAGAMGWPKAIIVYNNEPGALDNAAVSDMNLYFPVVCISGDDGELLANSQAKTVTVDSGASLPASTDYAMSDFSSWGVTPDLNLKPEITAPGGNIYSSVLDNGYAYMSGTSMATPQMTGISAQMHQYIENDAKFAGLSDSERSDAVTQLLMSTATPIADQAVEGSYYSPRKQGAGLANVKAATASDVFATVEGASDVSRPKADLGESATGAWNFTVTLTNLGAEEHMFAADGAALSEQVADGLFQLQSDNWTGKGIDVTFGGDAYDAASGTVSVPAGGKASFTVSVTCGDAFASWAAQNTPNGTFVDGFALLAATDGGVDLSVPFLGFYGDWSQSNVFDGQAITEDGTGSYHMYGTVNSDPNGLPLGVNLLDATASALVQAGDYSKVDVNKMVVSNMGYDSAPSQFIPLTGLLRGVDNLTYTYKNEAGETVLEYSHDAVSKSYYYASGGYVIPADARIGYYSSFAGKDSDGRRLPDGKYTLERTAATAGPGGETQTDQVASFYYDTTGPQITDIEYAGEGEEATVSFKVTDLSWLAAFDFHDPETGGYFYRINPTSDPVTNEDGTHTWSFTTKISDIKAAWDKVETQIGGTDPCPNTVPLYAWDYGLNPSKPASVVVTPIAAESVTLDSTELSLSPGQQTQLNATVLPEESTEKNLVWSSSDESVAAVDQAGNVTAVADGTATITAASALNPDVKAQATVNVAAVSDEVGIVMASKSVRIAPDGSTQVKALVADSLKGQTITWTSDNADIASVEANEDGSATVTAGTGIGNATLTASVQGLDGKTRSATMTAEVRPANYDEFVIDEATGTMLGYAGNSSYVEVPNNVKRINDQAFMSTPVQEVVVPSSVESIGYQAFSNCPKLTTVTFQDTAERPSQLREVGEQAFYNNLKLKEVKFPKSVEKLGAGVLSSTTVQVVDFGGATVIPRDALSSSPQAYDVTVSDNVTKIGDGAFMACLGLGELKLADVEGAQDGETKGLPSQLQEIGSSAFSGTALSGEIVMPAGVKTIGDGAFGLASGITSVQLNEGLKYLGGSAFASTKITELTMPDSVNSVGEGVFASMGSLSTINLNANIPDGALVKGFVGDTSLLHINIPKDCKYYSVKDNVLFNKNGSRLITYPLGVSGSYAVPEGVTEICDYAFYKGAETEVTFPSTLKSTGEYSFCEGKLAGSVVLPDGMETVGHGSFMNLAITSANIGGAINLGGSAFYSCPSLTDVDLRTDLNRLQSVGNQCFGLSSAIQAIIMPDSLTTLGEGAFSNISALRKVHIGAGLTGNISMFVTGANELSELTVSEDNPVYSADRNVLYGNMEYSNGEKDGYGNTLLSGKHLILSLPTNDFEEYEVAPGTVEIDAQAFRNNANLKKVVLPEGLRQLDTGAFNNCTSLTDINFPNSLEHVDGLYSVPLDVADFGPNVSYISDSAFMGDMPNHLILRGMTGSGAFEDSMDFTDDGSMASAYFGPGVKKAHFNNVAPKTIVLSSTVEAFSIAGTAFGGDTAEETAERVNQVCVYAGSEEVAQLAKDSLSAEFQDMKKAMFAWWGQLPADFDIDAWTATHIKLYTPLAVELTNAAPTVPGATVQVTATAVGGVDGQKQFRFFQQNADGSETLLSDWSDANAINWQVPADGTNLRAEVRDATMLTAGDVIGEVSAPVLVRDLETAPVTVVEGGQAPVLAVVGSAAAGEQLTYQWFCDGVAVEGANQASFAPDVLPGEHTYYVVLTSSANGASAMVKSSEVVVRGVAPAVVPEFTAQLPELTETTVGKPVSLTAVATSADGGVLTYQWFCDGAAIEGAIDATYTVDATEVGKHTYSVEVTNTLGVASNAASVRSGDAVVEVKAEKSALNRGIEHAKQAIEGLNESDYTAESWKALQDALTAAEGVLASDDATQNQVDAAASALTAAFQGLVKAPANPGEGDQPGDKPGDQPGGDQPTKPGDGTDQPGGSNQGGNNGGAGDAANGSASGSASGNGSTNGAASGNAATATGGKLSQTGDMAPVAPIVGGGLIAALGAIISAAALRLRKRNN